VLKHRELNGISILNLKPGGHMIPAVATAASCSSAAEFYITVNCSGNIQVTLVAPKEVKRISWTYIRKRSLP